MQSGTPTQTHSYGTFSIAANVFEGQAIALASVAIDLFVCAAAMAAARFAIRRESLDMTNLTGVRLFSAGASIYFFTLLLGSNFGYRLVYLSLCIPFLCRQHHAFLS